jgi:F-type H+-transporting ATPase subunit b
MAFDASFYALVGLILFFVLIAYLKVPGMLASSLDERAKNITEELAEAKRLREEAQHLLAEYQRKRKEAEADAAAIVAAAERRVRRSPYRAFRAEDQAG